MNTSKNNGYITLGNVIAVGSMALAVAMSLLIIGINTYESGSTVEKSVVAQSLAEGCAEIALNNLRLSPGYSGDETITIDENSCSIDPFISNADGTTTINCTGTVNDIVRKTQIIIAGTTPSIQVSSWKEVADF